MIISHRRHHAAKIDHIQEMMRNLRRHHAMIDRDRMMIHKTEMSRCIGHDQEMILTLMQQQFRAHLKKEAVQ